MLSQPEQNVKKKRKTMLVRNLCIIYFSCSFDLSSFQNCLRVCLFIEARQRNHLLK